MYTEDTFKPLALPYCFGMHIKQEDTQVMQIQEVVMRHNCINIDVTCFSLAVSLAMTDLGQEFSMDVKITIGELDRAACTWIEHVLHLASSSFNGFSDERRKEAVNKSGDPSMSWLVCKTKINTLAYELFSGTM